MEKENRTILALIHTKSNYQNLNGCYVTVKKFCGSIVWCEYEDKDKIIRQCDFSINEITKIIEIN